MLTKVMFLYCRIGNMQAIIAIHNRMFEVSFQLSEFSNQFQDGGFKSKTC